MGLRWLRVATELSTRTFGTQAYEYSSDGPDESEVAKNAREMLPKPLEFLDRRLDDGRPFLAGERPSVADCTLAAAFQFGRFGGVEIDASFENLARWDQAFRSRPSAKSVLLL